MSMKMVMQTAREMALRRCGGAVTVEFVFLFPLMAAMLVLCFMMFSLCVSTVAMNDVCMEIAQEMNVGSEGLASISTVSSPLDKWEWDRSAGPYGDFVMVGAVPVNYIAGNANANQALQRLSSYYLKQNEQKLYPILTTVDSVDVAASLGGSTNFTMARYPGTTQERFPSGTKFHVAVHYTLFGVPLTGNGYAIVT